MKKLNFNQNKGILKELAENKFKEIAHKSLTISCSGLFYEPKIPNALLKTDK
ncbi:AgrD family cyclic lactone autoinducer peptide [Listeria booriae]|uniref:Cyclic lactone autoinducer peptide n=1 Tax=Listeria booriae TaxID=1552123 RepID=A0A7X1CWJ1_9LIST|nr:cyclic lactone autoinducer peptide [Listeria booriae]MBC1559456.1 cyclic lactone autoinducer peptide [Listeria booriae]MBC1562977.1 cyclic lactone autoinducer peptide [Listeria booriae]MBC2057221.1 cyclic lactone autoinducer peptide [Listeria booriae]MBC2241400.1 cyclic lactone autoinducer peptide [Listeria booriae]MBC2244571.1 cyclic lactone autoinducer peptide [Listeria booriae]